MFTDQELRVSNGQDVRASDPDYSAAIDLTKSPDMGAGNTIIAVVIVDTYTAGSSTGTNINVVVGDQSTFGGTNRIIGTAVMSAAQLEARDDDANKQAIIIKLNPDHDTGTDVSGVAQRYLGLQFDHATAPTAMTVTAYFQHESFHSDPGHSHHDSGFTIS